MINKVKIFSREYEIVEKECLEHGSEAIGRINYIEGKIELKADVDKDLKEITLLHEVIHGILGSLGFDQQNENEQLIDSLSVGLHQVIKDNKRLLLHILGKRGEVPGRWTNK